MFAYKVRLMVRTLRFAWQARTVFYIVVLMTICPGARVQAGETYFGLVPVAECVEVLPSGIHRDAISLRGLQVIRDICVRYGGRNSGKHIDSSGRNDSPLIVPGKGSYLPEALAKDNIVVASYDDRGRSSKVTIPHGSNYLLPTGWVWVDRRSQAGIVDGVVRDPDIRAVASNEGLSSVAQLNPKDNERSASEESQYAGEHRHPIRGWFLFCVAGAVFMTSWIYAFRCRTSHRTLLLISLWVLSVVLMAYAVCLTLPPL